MAFGGLLTGVGNDLVRTAQRMLLLRKFHQEGAIGLGLLIREIWGYQISFLTGRLSSRAEVISIGQRGAGPIAPTIGANALGRIFSPALDAISRRVISTA